MLSLSSLLASAPPPAAASVRGKGEKPPEPAKLRALADAMQKSVDEKRSPAIAAGRMTARRARIATGMGQDADRLERVQTALYALANAAEADELPRALWPVRTRAFVEDLLFRARYPGRAHGSSVQYVLRRAEPTHGSTPAFRKVTAWFRRFGESGEADIDLDVADALDDLLKVASTGYLHEDVKQARRAIAAGLGSQAAWAAGHVALERVVEEHGPTTRRGPSPQERRIRDMERALYGRTFPGYVPTPKRVVARMLNQVVELGPGWRTLEPSAGKGDIADAVRATGASVDVVEFQVTLRDVLAAKGHRVVGSDIFALSHGDYDAAFMNPPFEKGQDMDHVRHVYTLVRRGGVLVAIVSEGPFFRGDKKSEDFRAWLDRVGGQSAKLPEGAFEESDVPTSVATRLVVVRKR